MHEIITETAPIGLTALDEDGTILWANEVYADTLDVPRDELVGRSIPDLVAEGYYDEEMIDRYLEVVRTLLSSSADVDRYTFRVETHVPDGETLHHDVSTALLPLDDGEFQGTVHAFRDITTQKEYERVLDEQNERLEEFASVVSHDLRNPLNVAQGHLEGALKTGDRAALRNVQEAHARMETLIEDLLSLAIEGQRIRDPDPVEIEAVARRAWNAVDTADVDFEIVGVPGTVPADAGRLQQLFENLFRNSVEHNETATLDGEPLAVLVGQLEDGDGFFVEDTGTGIPPDVRSKVFDHGYTASRNGTGYGLGIVDGIADAHGWDVDIVDAEGARFEFDTGSAGSS